MVDQNFDGKAVLITGASRGIGEAAARAFAAAGANVVLTARSADALTAIATELGEKVLALPCDVANADAVQSVVDQAITTFGGLDVLIGNAGMIEPISHIAETDIAAYGRTIDVNLKGVFYGMRAVLPHMIARGSGTIITISSGAAHSPMEGWAAYCSAKAGAFMLTRMADHEYRSKGLRVLGLSPGTIATQMQREIKSSGINPVSQKAWEDHLAPEWPAKALMWMCTEAADDYLGADARLRDETVSKAIGLT